MQSSLEIWTAHKIDIERLLIEYPNGTGLKQELQAADEALEAIAKGTYSDTEMCKDFLQSIGDLTPKIAEIAKPPAGNPLEYWTGQKLYVQRLLDEEPECPVLRDGLDEAVSELAAIAHGSYEESVILHLNLKIEG